MRTKFFRCLRVSSEGDTYVLGGDVLGLLKGIRRTVLRLSARERIGKAHVCPREDVKRDAEAGGPSALLQTFRLVSSMVR